MKKIALAIMFLAVLLLAACGSNGNSNQVSNQGGNGNSNGSMNQSINGNTDELKYENVGAQQAKELIDQNKVVVLDVRTLEEYQAGHIPNATLIPVQELESRLGELDKNTAYLVVCRSGNRSLQASEILVNNGFTHITNMEGGMNSWTYEVEK